MAGCTAEVNGERPVRGKQKNHRGASNRVREPLQLRPGCPKAARVDGQRQPRSGGHIRQGKAPAVRQLDPAAPRLGAFAGNDRLIQILLRHAKPVPIAA